jgi:hypothetical protein
MLQSSIKLRDVLPPCSTYCSIVVSASQHPTLWLAWLSKLLWSLPAPAIVLQLIVIRIPNGCSDSHWISIVLLLFLAMSPFV